MIIAPLTPDQQPALVALQQPLLGPDSWSEQQLSRQLVHPDSINVGVFDQQQLVGFALVRTLLDQAELYQIALLPAYRGRGLARQVLNQLRQQLARQQIGQLLLEVRASNQAAQGCYQAAGFTLQGRRRHYYRLAQGREDALLYQCLCQDEPKLQPG